MGLGITRQQVVAKLPDCKSDEHKQTSRMPSLARTGLKNFKRHPDLSLRSPTPLCKVHCRLLNQAVTNKYFTELGEIVQTLNLQDKPECIWNMDETLVSLCHKPTKVYAQ